MAVIESSIFAFATDFADEGVDAVLRNIAERGGLDGVSLAVAYHHGRDIFPHNPVHRVRFLEGGAVFFRPDIARYQSLAIKPHVSRLARRQDILAEVTEAARRRSLTVDAWTVFLHNYTLGERYPDCVERNAFGDRYLTDLCPANPDVRAYAVTLASDIARYEPRAIIAESLHYHPLEHGFHHERYLIDLGPTAAFLLGLCFCRHCRRSAARVGVDVESLQQEVVAVVERALAAAPRDYHDEILRDHVGSLAGGEMEGYLQARTDTVSSLAAEVSQTLDATETHLAFIDPSGAVKGYATGEPTGEPTASIAWRFGIDLADVGRNAGEFEVIGYAADPARLRLDLEAYAAATPSEVSMSAILRPTLPDCDAPANLAEKVRLASELDVARVSFYHYGLMRLTSLDWIQQALRGG